jgi:hypothetical protein
MKMTERFYIDCEFDGHNGPLLSIAMVREDGYGMHVRTTADASDPWVLQNVLPLMGKHKAELYARVHPNEVGHWLRAFLSETVRPVIIADSPVDIGRFCAAISTDKDGGWASANYPQMTFEVHNVDCYPTDLPNAVQHNAYWDAMALRHKLASCDTHPKDGDVKQAPLVSGAVGNAASPNMDREDNHATSNRG